MNILITGISGYIGSHVALALAEEHSLVGLDVVAPHMPLPGGVIFYQGDIGDAELVERIVREHSIEAICHLAAFVSVEESQREPEKYFENNTKKTEILIEAAKKAGAREIIFSSTAAVYGTPDQIPVSEDAPLKPESAYGQSKQQAEDIIRAHADDTFRFVILRYFNVAGADPLGRAGYVVEEGATHLIRRAVLAAVGEIDAIDVFGTDYPTPDGTGVRDYIHVVDIAGAHIAALKHLASGGASGTYNVGYGKGYSVLEILSTVERISGKTLPIRYAPRRDGDVAAVVADATAIKTNLRWTPQYAANLDQAIEGEYRWVRNALSRQ